MGSRSASWRGLVLGDLTLAEENLASGGQEIVAANVQPMVQSVAANNLFITGREDHSSGAEDSSLGVTERRGQELLLVEIHHRGGLNSALLLHDGLELSQCRRDFLLNNRQILLSALDLHLQFHDRNETLHNQRSNELRIVRMTRDIGQFLLNLSLHTLHQLVSRSHLLDALLRVEQ